VFLYQGHLFKVKVRGAKRLSFLLGFWVSKVSIYKLYFW